MDKESDEMAIAKVILNGVTQMDVTQSPVRSTTAMNLFMSIKEICMKLSNKAYDILKYIAQIVLPALATLIVSVFGIWNINYAEAVSGTIMAVDFFLGALLKISSNNYYKDENDEVKG